MLESCYIQPCCICHVSRFTYPHSESTQSFDNNTERKQQKRPSYCELSHFPKSNSNSKTMVITPMKILLFFGGEGGISSLLNPCQCDQASLHPPGLLNLITADKHCQLQLRRPKSKGSFPPHHSGLLRPLPRLGGTDPFPAFTFAPIRLGFC